MFNSSFEIARSHIRLAVNRDLNALKHVLRDWLRYTEHTPLQHKPAFSALLRIEVRRPQPPYSDAGLSQPIPETPFRRGLVAWRRQQQQPPFGDTISPKKMGWTNQQNRLEIEARPIVFVKHVPLELWTALLPWEVQRGLSGSVLEEPIPRKGPVVAETAPTLPLSSGGVAQLGIENLKREEEEEEDPYGIVSVPASGGRSDTRRQSEKCGENEENTTNRGLLFVLNVKHTKGQGAVRFWSGGIVKPIDVLFFAPTRPSAVAQSPSFQGLRKGDMDLKLKSNEMAEAVAEHFFPNDELRSSLTEFQLHTHGHLDPFPSFDAVKALPSDDVGQSEAKHTIEARFPPSASPDQIPNYVLEIPRHFLRHSIELALQESKKDYERTYGTAFDSEADLRLTLELSETLKTNLMAKAQLYAQYAMPLEEAVAFHLRRLNVSPNSDAECAAMGEGEAESGAKERNARVQVWLSEDEQRWLTPQELAALQTERTRQSLETPWQAQQQDEKENADDWAQSSHTEAESDVSEERIGKGSPVGESGADASIVAAGEEKEEAVSSLHAIQPAQPGGTDARRSLRRYSPTLAEEDAGRPSYLTPSFHGRHDARLLRQHALVVNADHLARYPRTRSHMPLLPPIDYELFELCLRLGVGREGVLYYYYPRLVREWRQELRRLWKQRGTVEEKGEANTAPASQMQDEDVRRMVRLVRDSSLQVPDELRFLVEAVHQHKGGEGAL